MRLGWRSRGLRGRGRAPAVSSGRNFRADVSGVAQRAEARRVGGGVQVERERALVEIAVDERERTIRCRDAAGERGVQAARIAARRLDLDDVGAEVGEQAAGEGVAQIGEIDDAQVREGPGHARLVVARPWPARRRRLQAWVAGCSDVRRRRQPRARRRGPRRPRRRRRLAITASADRARRSPLAFGLRVATAAELERGRARRGMGGCISGRRGRLRAPRPLGSRCARNAIACMARLRRVRIPLRRFRRADADELRHRS